MEDRGRDDRYRAGSLRDFWIGPGLAGASPLGGGATPGRPTKAPARALKGECIDVCGPVCRRPIHTAHFVSV